MKKLILSLILLLSLSGNAIAVNPYGDGSDGDVTISSNTNLTEVKQYESLTVNTGVTLNTAGYTVKVRQTLTNNGTITDSSSGGAGGGGGSAGTGGSADGETVVANNGTGGSAGSSGSAGSGGAGSGGDGGTGGGGGGGAASKCLCYYEPNWYYVWCAGYGKNGGNAGSGGKGGGIVTVYAKTFTNNGIIHTNGFNGTNGSNGATAVSNGPSGGYCWNHPFGTCVVDACGGGGGGGGGGDGGDGGTVSLTYQDRTIGTATANGGTAGNAGSGGGCVNNVGLDCSASAAGTGGSGGGSGGTGCYYGNCNSGSAGSTGSAGSAGTVTWTQENAYEDSGIRYRKGDTTYSIAYEDLEATHKLRFRKGATTVGLVLIDTTDGDASHIRIDEGATKAWTLYQ